MAAKNAGRPGYTLIVTRYITRKGKRIYPKNGTVFAFWVSDDKLRR